MSDQFTQDRVGTLAKELLAAIRPYLARQPYSNDNVYTVLNALGVAAAVALVGTGPAPAAVEFFLTSLSQQLEAAMSPDLETAIARAATLLKLLQPDSPTPVSIDEKIGTMHFALATLDQGRILLEQRGSAEGLARSKRALNAMRAILADLEAMRAPQ